HAIMQHGSRFQASARRLPITLCRRDLTDMTVAFHQLAPCFAAEVSGIDGTRPLSCEEVAAVEAGMDQDAVLVFREQGTTNQQRRASTKQFGELENYQTGGHIRPRSDSRLSPGIADFSNLDRKGNILPAEDRVWFFKLGDRLWHSDSSFRPVPA